jgi:hypothetical protein
MDEMATHGITSTQERCARCFRSIAYDSIRGKPLVETTAEDLLVLLHVNGNSVGHYLRRSSTSILNSNALRLLASPRIASSAHRYRRRPEPNRCTENRDQPEGLSLVINPGGYETPATEGRVDL